MEPKYYDLYQKISDSSGICSDSRLIKEGECFFTLSGLSHKGSKFIEQALAQGAKYIITDDLAVKLSPNIFYVESVQKALAFCLKFFYPHLPKHKVIVTGTNGKSSIVDYCRQIMSLLGVGSASIGTMGVMANIELDKGITDLAKLTSNDLVANYKILSSLKRAGVEFVALEGSSIGACQGRLEGLKFDAAAFSTFSQDHLDYHNGLSEYMLAKLKIFAENLESGKSGALVCITQDVISQIESLGLKMPIDQYITIGNGANAAHNVRILEHKADLSGQYIEFLHNQKTYNFHTHIVGKFQGTNLLLAIFLCSHFGFSIEQILSVIPNLIAVKGRLQKIAYGDKHIFIDYAHNPDALKRILTEARELQNNARIITIFGCGGDRDKEKRPMMGQIAADLSDYIIITDDNPRSEDPVSICSQIVAGINHSNYKVIHNRKNAICMGLNMLNNYDMILILGKGHEEYQTYKNMNYKFSDEEVVKQNIIIL